MCGIVGIFNINNRAKKLDRKNFADLKKALNVQKHRGPDDNGITAFCFDTRNSSTIESDYDIRYDYDGIIGFNRLSIKDLSINGHQPMSGLNGQVILAFNGEIYNDTELRNHLLEKGYKFKSCTDTEVILNLYIEYGFEKMIAKLNGMFAILIVDLRNGVVYAARDRFGIKPLYYAICSHRIIFVSELKSIIQFRDFERELDDEGFYNRIIFSRVSDSVLLKNGELVKPGQLVCFQYGGHLKKQEYFNINQYERLPNDEAEETSVLRKLEETLYNAISRQLKCDVRVGCQLSGGIDSTIITHLAKSCNPDNVEEAISIVGSYGSEDEYIDRVGNSLGLSVHKSELTDEYFVSNYEKVIWHNDAPVYQPYFICFYKLAETARNNANLKVLLSGEGADEIAGGYGRFAAGVYQPLIQGGYGAIKSYKSYAEYAVMSDSTITKTEVFNWDGYDNAIQKQIDIFNNFSGSNFMRHLKFEIAQRLPEALLRQDKMCMAHSIENRVPFLDNEVVDILLKIPEKYLIQFAGKSPFEVSDDPFAWVQGKAILKVLVSSWYGRDFAYRKKQIMTFDRRKLIQSKRFKEYVYSVVFPGMRSRGLMSEQMVRNLYDHASQISNQEFNVMWRAISSETWCQIFLDRGNR